ncbi:hypothetical protein A2U01_0045500, partial [Trifolium medium]|nr:hypothetical protein [Trifolium medium]
MTRLSEKASLGEPSLARRAFKCYLKNTKNKSLAKRAL